MNIQINKNLTFSYQKPPIIIAEISGNHNGSKKKFINLIKKAYDSGADIVKIQSYEPKDITLNLKSKKFIIDHGIWKGKSLWELYKKAHTPLSWHASAFKYAKKRKKIIFSSPFSIRAVDLLEKLKVPLYKIASFEITDLNLIDYVASKKKPIIISSGMASIKELFLAVKTIKKYHNKIIILHCISDYPTQLRDTNLSRINYLKKIFPKYLIGISDHTKNLISSMAATTLGVVTIEKHYKDTKNISSIDSEFSIDSESLKELKENTVALKESLLKKNSSNDNKFKSFRRSLFAIKNIKKNESFNKKNIQTFRPKIGICSSKYFEILNKKAKVNIRKYTPIYYWMIKK
jgi:pseudaminic acid synthase